MCLTTTRLKLRKTRLPRVYWKVLLGNYGGTRKYTPYKGMEVESGVLYEESGWHFDTRVERIDGKRTCCIDGRGYHLGKTWFGARKLWKELTRAQDAKIVMAVVPRGTYYISGDYDGCRSVVVKKVKYKF